MEMCLRKGGAEGKREKQVCSSLHILRKAGERKKILKKKAGGIWKKTSPPRKKEKKSSENLKKKNPSKNPEVLQTRREKARGSLWT